MSLYECVFIARQDVSSAQVDALSDQFAKVIDDFGGKVTKRESWGLRTLAFRIKKNRKGHYILFNIDGPAAAVEELDRQMRINEDILRHMTVRVETLQEEPSAILQNRGGRDDRGGRRDDRFRGDRGRGGDGEEGGGFRGRGGEGGEGGGYRGRGGEGGEGGGYRGRGGEGGEGGGYRGRGGEGGEGGGFRRGGDEGGPRRSADQGEARSSEEGERS